MSLLSQAVTIEIECEDMTPAAQNQIQAAVRDLEQFDRIARRALLEEASAAGADRAVPLYIDHHLHELDLVELFGTAAPTAEQFLAKMALERFSFDPGEPEDASLDYTLGRDLTDNVLVVRLDWEGNVHEIAMES